MLKPSRIAAQFCLYKLYDIMLLVQETLFNPYGPHLCQGWSNFPMHSLYVAHTSVSIRPSVKECARVYRPKSQAKQAHGYLHGTNATHYIIFDENLGAFFLQHPRSV